MRCGLCIACGRDPRGFKLAAARIHQGGAYVKFESYPYARLIPEKNRTAKMFIAVLVGNNRELRVIVDEDKERPIIVINGGEKLYYTDVLNAWMACKPFFETGKLEEQRGKLAKVDPAREEIPF